jgi:type I restriction enzyme S subunit
MSSLVPVNWRIETLENLTNSITVGHVGSTSLYYRDKGIPFIRTGNLNSGKIVLNDLRYITLDFHEKLKKSKLQVGDVLVSRVGYTGNAAIVPEGFPEANCANIIIIRTDETVYPKYLHSFINSPVAAQQNAAFTVGSAQAVLNTGAIKKLIAIIPPLPEQQKIAQILTSVDEVIEKTQAQIDKLKDLKTAMMQELLTKGIGHVEFKDSPVGRIPVGWEVKTLEALSSFVTSGSRGWAQYYSSTGAIFIRIGNLTREHINFRFKDIIYVTPPNSAEGKRTLVQEGDVLISITADLGIIAVVNKSIGEAYVNQHVSLVRLDDPSMARWVGHFLAFEDSRKQFTANNDAGAKAGLNLTAIRKTQVALPSKNERRKIVEALDSVDKLISEKRRKLNVTNDTKKALMQDLLTGKVRVKVS